MIVSFLLFSCPEFYVLHFHVLRFHPLRFRWSVIFMSCIFIPRDFDSPSFSYPTFSVDPLRVQVCFTHSDILLYSITGFTTRRRPCSELSAKNPSSANHCVLLPSWSTLGLNSKLVHNKTYVYSLTNITTTVNVVVVVVVSAV